MVYAVRERECSDCGAVVKGRFPLSKPVQCIDCAIKRQISAAKQMAARSGPYYDQWLKTRGPKGRPRRN